MATLLQAQLENTVNTYVQYVNVDTAVTVSKVTFKLVKYKTY